MCLLGLPAMAFVTPHVQLRPFAPNVPDVRGAPDLPPRRQHACTTTMVAPSTRGAEPDPLQKLQLWLGSVGVLKQPAASAATARTPKALDVVNRWRQDAACSIENGRNTGVILEEQARWAPRIDRAEAMKAYMEWKKLADVHMDQMLRTEALLSHMGAQIAEGGYAEYVFALTTSESAVDIQAVAAVTSMDIEPSDGGFKTLASLIREQGLSPKEGANEGSLDVVHISDIVAVPRADRAKGVGAELIRRISRWAAASGRLVTIVPSNGEVRKYYKGFGFKDIKVDGLTSCMVYGGQGLDYSAEWERFRMITLDK